MEVPDIGTFRFDPLRRRVAAFVKDGVAQDGLLDCYYRAVLPLALQFFGSEALHASAIRTDAGVVGFCAVSGTGKSTTVAALTRRGFPLWADDALVFDCRTGMAPRAIPVPCRMRLDQGAAGLLGVDGVRRGWLDGSGPDAPLAALCVLQRDADARDGAEIRRLSNSEALTALIPHAYCFSMADMDRKRRTIEQYFNLAACTPIHLISFAPGFDRLQRLLDRIEREIPGFARAAPVCSEGPPR